VHPGRVRCAGSLGTDSNYGLIDPSVVPQALVGDDARDVRVQRRCVSGWNGWLPMQVRDAPGRVAACWTAWRKGHRSETAACRNIVRLKGNIQVTGPAPDTEVENLHDPLHSPKRAKCPVSVDLVSVSIDLVRFASRPT